jgi:flagellar FliL protein
MKIIIIAVVALLVLGGAGAGAYFYFSQPAEAASGAEVGKDHEKNKQAKKEGGGHGEGGGVEFVELDPLILPIIDKDGVSQVVSLVVALEVPDAAKKEEVKKLAPLLKDAFIQDMYGELNQQMAVKGGVIQVAVIKERLSKISIKVLGKDSVNGVLLQVVQQRPA